MAITAADVMKLRKMTSAGMMDCKKALEEAQGDFNKAMDIIREKGKLVAAKRSDRETSEGAVKARIVDGKGIGVGYGISYNTLGVDSRALVFVVESAAAHENSCRHYCDDITLFHDLVNSLLLPKG